MRPSTQPGQRRPDRAALAAETGKPDAAAALLGFGADAALRDAEGETALELAEAPADTPMRDMGFETDEEFAARVQSLAPAKAAVA